MTLCVNLSAEQLNHPDLVRNVARTLEETGLAPYHLMLEVGETDLMADCAFSMSILERLKNLGVTLAADDFGTGRSSLPYLNRFPVDFLKIAPSIISGFIEDPEKYRGSRERNGGSGYHRSRARPGDEGCGRGRGDLPAARTTPEARV